MSAAWSGPIPLTMRSTPSWPTTRTWKLSPSSRSPGPSRCMSRPSGAIGVKAPGRPHQPQPPGRRRPRSRRTLRLGRSTRDGKCSWLPPHSTFVTDTLVNVFVLPVLEVNIIISQSYPLDLGISTSTWPLVPAVSSINNTALPDAPAAFAYL